MSLQEIPNLSHTGLVPKSRYVERYRDIGDLRHRLIKPVVYDYLRWGNADRQ